jgi:hypothetical protein
MDTLRKVLGWFLVHFELTWTCDLSRVAGCRLRYLFVAGMSYGLMIMLLWLIVVC